MNTVARFEAFIPPEPQGLQIVRDRWSRVWVRNSLGMWASIGLIGAVKWTKLLVDAGPLYPVEWSDGPVAGEQGGAPQADDHTDR